MNESSPPVRLEVGDRAVARISALAAGQVPGVVGLRPELRQTLLDVTGSLLGRGADEDRSRLPTDGVRAVVRDDTADVDVTVVTTLGHNCRDLVISVQEAVAAEVLRWTGLTARVRVTVADIILS